MDEGTKAFVLRSNVRGGGGEISRGDMYMAPAGTEGMRQVVRGVLGGQTGVERGRFC